MDHISDISQLRELLNESSREIQENIILVKKNFLYAFFIKCC